MKKIDRKIIVLVITVVLLPYLVYAGELCEDNTPIIRFCKGILTFFQFLIPICLFVIGLIKLIIAILKKNKNKIKEAFKKLVIKIVIGIIVFFVILLINIGLSYYEDSQDDGSSLNCWNEIE